MTDNDAGKKPGLFPGAIAAIEALVDLAESMTDENKCLTEERDRLLATLKEIVKGNMPPPISRLRLTIEDAQMMARAAVASVETR